MVGLKPTAPSATRAITTLLTFDAALFIRFLWLRRSTIASARGLGSSELSLSIDRRKHSSEVHRPTAFRGPSLRDSPPTSLIGSMRVWASLERVVVICAENWVAGN